VPRLGQPTAEVAGVVTTALDINSASADDLMALPGIGEVYSRRVVDSRLADGPFGETDELVSRGLIPRSTFERIRGLVTAGP